MNQRIPLPNKKYLGIKEVSEICEVSQNVLRAWETKFDCLKRVQRRNKRRYYTHENVYDIVRIKELTKEQGYTLNGANQFMRSGKPALRHPETKVESGQVEEIIGEIEAIRQFLKE